MAFGIFLAGFSSLLNTLPAHARHVPSGSTAQLAGHGSRPPVAYPPIPSDQPRPEFWLPDEPIEAMCVDGGRLYIGGQFSQVGPYTGPFAVMDASTGLPDLQWPRCDGYVLRGDGHRHGSPEYRYHRSDFRKPMTYGRTEGCCLRAPATTRRC
jgi:hypothetical protein